MTSWKIPLSLINHNECIARSRGEWRVSTDGRRRWVDEWGIAVMGKLRKQRAREARRSGFPCLPDYSYSITHMIMYCVNPSEYGVRDQISPDLLLLYFPYRSTWFNKIQYKPIGIYTTNIFIFNPLGIVIPKLVRWKMLRFTGITVGWYLGISSFDGISAHESLSGM